MRNGGRHSHKHGSHSGSVTSGSTRPTGTCMMRVRFAWDATMAGIMHGRLPRQHVATNTGHNCSATQTVQVNDQGRQRGAFNLQASMQLGLLFCTSREWPGKCTNAAGTVASAYNARGPHTAGALGAVCASARVSGWKCSLGVPHGEQLRLRWQILTSVIKAAVCVRCLFSLCFGRTGLLSLKYLGDCSRPNGQRRSPC
jgi:hypothetical protein